jgi:hypothetical protein
MQPDAVQAKNKPLEARSSFQTQPGIILPDRRCPTRIYAKNETGKTQKNAVSPIGLPRRATTCQNGPAAEAAPGNAARYLGINYLITHAIHRGNMKQQWNLPDLPEKHGYPLIALLKRTGFVRPHPG